MTRQASDGNDHINIFEAIQTTSSTAERRALLSRPENYSQFKIGLRQALVAQFPTMREDDIEDVIAGTTSKIYDHLNKYDQKRGTFKNWCKWIAIRRAIDLFRRLNRESHYDQFDDFTDQSFLSEEDIADRISQELIRLSKWQLIDEVIAETSKVHQSVFELTREGLKPPDIANQLKKEGLGDFTSKQISDKLQYLYRRIRQEAQTRGLL